MTIRFFGKSVLHYKDEDARLVASVVTWAILWSQMQEGEGDQGDLLDAEGQLYNAACALRFHRGG